MTVGPTSSGWHVALRTDAGPRDGNEDAVLSMRLANGSLVVAVADGMGGLEMGDVASRTAVEALRRAMTRGADLGEAVRQANQAVLERAAGRPMGSTLVCAHAVGRRVTVANVGDSRAYRCTPLGVRRITWDHTHAEEARLSGATLDGAGMAGRWANALTRSLGARPDVEVDVFGPFELDDGESILLCSDGIHGVLDDERLEAWVPRLDDPDAAVDALLGAALEAGSQDNVSAVVLHRPVPAREAQAAGMRRAASWDPRVIMERSPLHSKQQGRRRSVLFGAFAIVVTAVAALAWVLVG